MTKTQRINYACRYCGSENLVFDGVCKWDVARQEYTLLDTYASRPYCGDCESEGWPEDVTVPDDAIIEQPYTVLLLRPDYVADNYGQDTYQAHVTAANVEEAITKGQEQAVEADLAPGCIPVEVNPEDYFVLSVHTGHLQDLKP